MSGSPDHSASGDHPSLACEGIMEAWDVQSNGCRAEAEDGRSATAAPLTMYLAFLEHKIGHLRGVLCSPAPQHQQVVSAELACIISQLASIANDLAMDAGTPSSLASSPSAGTTMDPGVEEERQEPPPPLGSSSPPPSYEVIELEREEILAPPHAHSCNICGKGFKRDTNLRMHMRAHGHGYNNHKEKATTSLPPAPETKTKKRPVYYSCPQAGCKRNRSHGSFVPLKTAVCVRNHYRRTHCAKTHACRRCGGVKRFAVLADLRTHEKHCGRDRWVCSCAASFSRREKLLAHVALFPAGAGHSLALPLPDETTASAGQCSTDNDTVGGGGVSGSGELLLGASGGEAGNMTDDRCFFSDIGMFDDFGCSDVKRSMEKDDGQRGRLSLDFCGFDGFDLFGTHVMNFDF